MELVNVCYICLVNSLGIETARALAVANAHVVMFCRNVQTAEELKKKIIAEKADAKVEIVKCDLSSLASVKAAADEFKSKGWYVYQYSLSLNTFHPGHCTC
jgi:NAD(P)-dependent dehydrogenase (short-subunit alcohol dehydrogenase family)